ncbi:hypothetical protein WN943_007770 [Citrus x changshan-huyou]
MSSILRKFKLREQTQSTDKATFVIRNGESVLKELIRASNGKYNPYCTFSAKELEIATNNYDSEKVIMKRSFYTLYKGFCQERLISVMKFDASKPRMYDCCINNIVYASQMIHRCFFKLIGCCLETQIPILVFEYINCGSLADRIRIQHNPQPQHEPLLLTHRLKIAKDIANAIAYLHVGFPRPVIFRDFKLSNILFNEENVAKLFDFSFSISIPEGETHVSDALRGTLPIFAPEYLTGNFNEKADVFSFGVFLGELLTGLRAFDLARLNEDDGYVALRDHVKKYFEEDRLNEIIDPLIMGDRSCSGKEQQLQAYAHLIFECVNESPVDRPTMGQVQSSSVLFICIPGLAIRSLDDPEFLCERNQVVKTMKNDDTWKRGYITLQLSWILRKLKRRRESADKTTFMTRNGETVLKELIAASNEYGTLADRLHCCGDHFEALSMTDRLKIAMDIAHAVAYLHLLNGKKPDDFVHAAFDLSCPLQEYLEELSELKRFNDVMVDSIIMEENSFPGKEQQFHVFKQLILKCIDVSPEDRPTIADLTKQLRQMHRSCM